jgi:hypothetical protein
MSEIDYNPDFLTEDQIRIKLLTEQTQTQATELSNTIDRLKSKTQRVSDLNDEKYRAFEIIKDAIESDDIEADADWLKEVAEVFSWELKREVNVRFTITGTASVSLPYGKELSDFSFSSSDVSIECDGWNNDAEVSVEDHQLEDIDEE